MPAQTTQITEYHCPGERSPISRAVHLGRLARFYPPCRRCPRRGDTATLSPRRVKQLAATEHRGESPPLFVGEGVEGVYLNDLDPSTARRLGVAFALHLKQRQTDLTEEPVVIMAGDDRPISSEIVAAVGEGLRWAAVNVVDIGPATAPCLAFAIDHLGCQGGILIGNQGGKLHIAGLKFWATGPCPQSQGGQLDLIRQLFETTADRPTRKHGSLRRFQADGPYLSHLAQHYHALRPLIMLLDTNSSPLLAYLTRLTDQLACRVLTCRTVSNGFSDELLKLNAHLAVRIDEDGERIQLWDEQARQVAAERFFSLVARYLLAQQPGGRIVLETGGQAQTARAIRASGGRVITADPRREQMYQTMRDKKAIAGGGPSGRFWYPAHDHYSADALMTLTLLLKILSQSDRRLSDVLDAETAVR